MVRSAVTLEDKYTEKSGRIYLSGLQALVRLPMLQHQIDKQAGLNTACFVSGYRGSPLGGVDIEFGRAKKFLPDNNIHFHPGLNEDLAATSVWGTQQVSLSKQGQYDGVLGIWYGKGPGVDRSLDVLKHANAAGTSKYGGVLALAGDDHACKSSTFPHQSEQAFVHAMMPVLHPSSISDALDLGLHGIAMSRYSGCWVAFKIISDFADSSASVMTDPLAMEFNIPTDFAMPETGLSIRWYDPPIEQEERLINFKLPAAKAYARANNLDKNFFEPAKKRLAIVTAGKAYQDTRQALEEMGINDQTAAELGISIRKLALVWPIEDIGLREFVDGFEEVLVIEEKRGFIEDQIKQALYSLPEGKHPRIVGKRTTSGALLLPETYELTPTQIGEAILSSLSGFAKTDVSEYQARLGVMLDHFNRRKNHAEVQRVPWYCSGCPHNTSTRVPEGSRALAGIGCHYMAMWMDRKTEMFTQMGGEGVPWIGQAPFTDEEHVFVNLGDGTYFHSGLLAIRASASADVNITYKILYNDAVAMTGGQPVDGTLTPMAIARQVAAEGVTDIYVVSDEPEKYGKDANFPKFTKIRHRDDLDSIQKDMREIKGCSVLIYDQTCAAEKRRRRKRGLMEDPAKRVVINERVCEGCGDCGVKSNCLSIAPVKTEFGRKRQIDQSTCNKDYSCLKGFCPSFVTVYGGALRKPDPVVTSDENNPFQNLPMPELPSLETPCSVLITGIGGTGIVTIGSIMAMAAHLEDKGCTTMDQTGLAQKGGAVTSHLKIARSPEHIHTVRINAGNADVVLGCDLLVTADGDALSRIHDNVTKVVLNNHKSQTGEFTHNTEWDVPTNILTESIRDVCGDENLSALDVTKMATALMGNSIASNMFMLGYAWQKGFIPLSQEAIFRALELNNVAVKMNQTAFMWGRLAADDLDAVKAQITTPETEKEAYAHRKVSETLEDMISRRMQSLTAYQSKGYAKRYQSFVDKTAAAEAALQTDSADLSTAVARYYYKLMAYKDEYEVARLYTDGAFMKQIKSQFDGQYKIAFNLAPPIMAKRDADGHLQKREFGRWIFPVFKVIKHFKFLRGSPLDIFGYSEERKTERRLIADYETIMTEALDNLTAENFETAVKLAEIPEMIRGYGHVKEAHLQSALKEQQRLLEKFRNPSADDEDKNASAEIQAA